MDVVHQDRKEILQNESEKKTATEVTALKDANILLLFYHTIYLTLVFLPVNPTFYNFVKTDNIKIITCLKRPFY